MLDSDRLATLFGVEPGTAGSDYLLLDGKIKLFCAEDKVILISDHARSYGAIKEAMWGVIAGEPKAHLMLTRSGDVALQLDFSADSLDETDHAAALVQTVMPLLVEMK